MSETGVALRLAGISMFSICLTMLVLWEIEDWMKPQKQRRNETKQAVVLIVVYLLMTGWAYLIFRVES